MSRSPLDDLPARLVPVFRLLVRGRPNREIADARKLAVETVEQYNSQIYAILECNGRVDLILRANRGDFGDLDEIAKVSE
jgi:DNA-binding NarL/FixJ family response regulator